MSDVERVKTDADLSMIRSSVLPDVIAAARRRFGRIEIHRAVSRHAALLCVAAAVCAATRPLVWPLHHVALWQAVVRAVLLAAAGTSTVLAVIVVRAWRRCPSLLGAARLLDHALGVAEVVASGFAFERDGRTDEMASHAIERARRAVAGIDLARVLVSSRSLRSRKERIRLAGAVVAAAFGLAVGGVDRILVERTLHPVTSHESSSAASLKKAADHATANVPRDANEPKDPKAEEVIEGARRAAEAAQRGDRRGAQEALDDMRRAARALEADEREQARSLRAIRDQLEGAAAAAKGASDSKGSEGSRPDRPSASASEALAKLKQELAAAGGDKEALQKMSERLERAESAARSAGEKAKGTQASNKAREGRGERGNEGPKGDDTRAAAWSRAAAALKEAREAAARGDADGAKRAMERAERELSALEKANGNPSRAGAMARLADAASELDRSMHAAMSGAPSENAGQEESPNAGGEDSGGEGKNKNAAGSKGDPSGTPGAGPGAGDRAPGPEQRRVKIDGDLQARTDVREGERAVSVIEGMGRGGDPKAYAEIFPSYDTVVEDGLREETVPAARRPVVRRYFSSIRPGGDEEESRKRP